MHVRPFFEAGSGWRNGTTLLGCHIGMIASAGPAIPAVFGLFLNPMSQDLGWSHTELALGLSVNAVASMLTVPVVGHLVDRLGARAVTLAGALFLPLGIVLFAASPPSWIGFLCASVFLGIFASFAGPTAYVSILPVSFDNRLGMAIAITMSGVGVGQILNATLASYAIAEFGWRGGWFAVAAWVGGLGLLAHFIVPWRNFPKSQTSNSEVQQSRTSDESNNAPPFWRVPTYWVLTGIFLLILMVTVSVQVTVAAALVHRGFSPAFGVTAVTTMGAATLIARLVVGVMLDKVSARIVGTIVFAAQGLGCVALGLVDTSAIVLLAVFLISFAFGAETDILAYVLRRRFGLARYGAAYGTCFGVVQVGFVLGPPATTAVFDTTGSYTPAYLALAACSGLAAVGLALALGKGFGHYMDAPEAPNRLA